MLVVTPAPYPTESLIGYAIRLAEANGYDSPGTVLCYAGYGSAHALGANCDLSLLANIVGQYAEDLAEIAYTDVRGEKTTAVSFRGHTISSWRVARVLSPKRTYVCPSCIGEYGYLDSFWDLTLATVCPKHGCRALSVCPGCKKNISWLRSGLLECRCGARLGECSPDIASNPELELLGLVQAKLEKRSLRNRRSRSGFPIAELNEMSFVQLVSVLFLLGQHLRRLSHKEALERPDLVVQAAANALSDWPQGFRKCLRELGKHEDGHRCPLGRLREQYGALYRSITGERSLASGATFLRDELDVFLEEEKSRAVLEAKRLRSDSNVRLRQSMTMDWICSQFGFSRKRLEGWCKAKRKDNAALSPTDLKRFVVEAEIVNHLKIAKTRRITERQAAAMAGIPVTVLRGLRQLGYAGPQSVENLRRGYRAGDIDNLMGKLRDVGKHVSGNSIQAKHHASLARLLETATFWSQLGKSEFLVDIIEGRIEPVGRTGESLQQLFFDRVTVDEYILDRKRAESKHAVTRTKAGRLLGCSSDCVNVLVDREMLATTSGPYYRNICRESVRKFGERYVALNDLTSRFETTVRALRRRAEEKGYKLLLINSRRGVVTPFIRRSQVERLQRFVEQWRSDAALRSAEWRDRVGSIDKLSQYLDSLRQSAKPLPRIGKRPNLREIAKASGICRNLFYKSEEARNLLATIEREDASRHQIDSRADLEILDSYLRKLRNSKAGIPIGRCGRPNKLEIARAAGLNRNIFYTSSDADNLIAQFQGGFSLPADGSCSKPLAEAVTRTGELNHD